MLFGGFCPSPGGGAGAGAGISGSGQFFLASTPTANRLYGSSCAITEDFAVVGGNGQFDTYDRVAGLWTQTAGPTLTAAQITTQVGNRVATDGTTIVASGALGATKRIVFYEKVADVWTEQQELNPTLQTVVAPVDVIGDTCVIGDSSDDVTQTNSGAVHVYVKTGGTWGLDFTVKQVPVVASRFFGGSVAMESETEFWATYTTGSGAFSVQKYNTSGALLETFALDNPDSYISGPAISYHDGKLLAAYEGDGANKYGQIQIYGDLDTTPTREETIELVPIVSGVERAGRGVALSTETIVFGRPATDYTVGVNGVGRVIFYTR